MRYQVTTKLSPPEALQRAIEHAPSVLDVAVTRDAVSPDFKNGLADLADYQALRAWNDLEVGWRSHPLEQRDRRKAARYEAVGRAPAQLGERDLPGIQDTPPRTASR